MHRFGTGQGHSVTFTARLRPRTLGAALVLAGAAAAAHAQRPPAVFDLVGSARRVQDSLQLTPGDGGTGAAWRHQAVSLTQSFTVRFRFSLRGTTVPQADGLAFVIQTDGVGALGDGGGCLGLCGLNAVASVVQTYTNDHVGFTLDAYPFDAPFSPVDLGYTRLIQGEEVVRYDAAKHLLSMQGRLDVDGVMYDMADSRAVDLASLLGADTATIGFTAGTGDSHADQRVWAFEFHYAP